MIDDRSTRSPVRFSTREMIAACLVVLVVFAIGVGLRASGSRWAGGASWALGGDFAMFYVAGRILDERGAASVYDHELEDAVYRNIVPGATALHRTYAYPPYIAELFRPLARLPLTAALAVFMIATPLVFLAAWSILAARFGPIARDARVLGYVAALSFFPFLGYTWLGAQISTLGFLSIAMTLALEDRGRLVASGLALSLCLYKPTLLLLILPMLVATGRPVQLAGFAAGAALQAVLWLATGAAASVTAFRYELTWYIEQATAARQFFNPYRYVDVNAFFRLLPYGRSSAATVLLVIIVCAMAAALVATWLRTRRADRPARLLAWAATIAWTPVLNIYVPLYDTVIVAAAALIAVAAVEARGWRGWHRLGPALLLVYATAWIGELAARAIRVQIFTLALGAFGCLLLVEANQAARRV
jgi:Glycosyltransferase family 87